MSDVTTHTIYGYDLFGRLASVTSARLLGQDQADPAGVYRFDAGGDCEWTRLQRRCGERAGIGSSTR